MLQAIRCRCENQYIKVPNCGKPGHMKAECEQPTQLAANASEPIIDGYPAFVDEEGYNTSILIGGTQLETENVTSLLAELDESAEH